MSGKVHWLYPILPFGIVACTVLPTPFLEIAVFEFMINTAPLASNSVYGREKLFWYNKITFPNHVCHCGAVVKELLVPADKPGSTPAYAVFCFFVPFFFFSVWSLFLKKLHFLWAFFSLFLLLTLLIMHLDQYWYFKLKSRVLFWKRDFKSSWSAYWPSLRPDKNHKLSRHVPPLKQLNFFQC